jgi:signal transduction histidine kinase
LKKGTVTYTKETFDLKALAAAAVERAKLAAEQKGLILTFATDDASYQMTGDKAQIHDHVLRNLIDNAVNYTPTGSISVSLKKEHNKFVFAVKDTGVGITDEDKKRLFTEGGTAGFTDERPLHWLPFTQVHHHEHRGTIR